MTARNSPKKAESTFVMDVAPSAVGLIIGRGGSRIKSIRRESGCNLWVDQDVPDDQPRKMFFVGTPSAVAVAVARVKELQAGAIPTSSGDRERVGGGVDTERTLSDILDCPPELVGLLIGKQGGTIHKIQQISGAVVSINQCVRPGLPRKVIISGDAAVVRYARSLVTEVLTCQTLQGEACTPAAHSTAEGEKSDNDADMHMLIAYLMTPSPGSRRIPDSRPSMSGTVSSALAVFPEDSTPLG